MRLCMISLDAVGQPDADRLLRLPALSALKESGVYSEQVRTVYPTITYPIHASLLTGCYPDVHGIDHNKPFQPDVAPEMKAWYWRINEIKAKTLHQAAWEKGMRVASVLWPTTGKNRYTRWNFPEVLPLPGENPTLKMLRYATPVWVLHMEALYGRQRVSIQQPYLDDYVTLLCEKLYASRRPPDVLTLHYADCDFIRHWHGADSHQAHDAIKRLGERVERILRAIEKAGLLQETLVCVVSDHGQQDAPNGVLLDQLLREACGARAQTLGMGAYIRGSDLAAARKALEENRAAWGIAHIYDEEELRALHAPTSVRLAVDALPGHRFIDRADNDFIGEHGFSMNVPEARVFLWLSGPGIKKGETLGEIQLVDIAPTLARCLGLSLPDAQGKAIRDVFA